MTSNDGMTSTASSSTVSTSASTASTLTQNSSNNNNNTSNKNNKQRNNKSKQSNNSNSSTSKYVGNEKQLAVLGVKNDEHKTDNFLVFQRLIENHVLTTFDHSGDIAYLVQELAELMPRLMKQMPTIKSLKKDYGIDPSVDDTKLSAEDQETVKELKDLLATERKAFVGRKSVLQSNHAKLFGLIWGQCTPLLQQDLRNLTKYKKAYESRDCLWLMNELKKSSSGSDDTQHPVLTFIRTIRTLFTTRQRENESLQDVGDRLESQLQSLKLIGGTLHPKYLTQAYMLKNTNTSLDDAQVAVEEKIVAILTIEGANDAKYGSVKRYLANQMVNGVDAYPDTKTQALTLLSKYIGESAPRKTNSKKGGDKSKERNSGANDTDTSDINVSFYQHRAPPVEGPPIPGTDGKLLPEARCYNCGRLGHISPTCGEASAVGFQGVQSEGNTGLPTLMKDSWLLVDSGSTFSSVANHHILQQCTSCPTMTSYTNGGTLQYSAKGPVALLPKVEAYFNGEAIANILSLHEVTLHYRVTMDSQAANSIYVHTDDEVLEFKGCGNGLYFIDVLNLDNHKNNANVTDYLQPLSLLNVVSSNKEYFTCKEVTVADNAWLLQARIGWPSDADFKRYIDHGHLVNCSTTIDDITQGNAIYGPLVPILKGKMTRQRPQHILQAKRVQIPSPVLAHHPVDDIAVDFFFVNKRIYLLMKSRIYKFHGLNANCRGRGKIETSTAIKHFINQFSQRGITIQAIHGDNEFEKIRPLVAPISVELCGREEHVPDIERAVRTVKERSRCTTCSLPYKRIPGLMIDANLQDKLSWLNLFPPHDYLSPSIGPAGMILGTPKVDSSTLKLDFGQYCQVHEGTTNSQLPRSVGAIALRPKNSRGSYYFMSLRTGKLMHSNNYTVLPITSEVIHRVESLAEAEGMPLMTDGELLFEWSPGVPILPENDSDNVNGLTITPSHSKVPRTPVIFTDVPPPQDPAQGAHTGPHSDSDTTMPTYTPTPAPTNTNAPGAPNSSQGAHGQNQGAQLDANDDTSTHSDDSESDDDDDSHSTEEEEDASDGEEGDYLDNTDPFDEKDETPDIEEEVSTDTGVVEPASDTTSMDPSSRATEEQQQNSRPKRERRAPQNYEPLFKGKSYALQLFNHHIKQSLKQHTPSPSPEAACFALQILIFIRIQMHDRQHVFYIKLTLELKRTSLHDMQLYISE